MGFARGCRPRRDRSALLDGRQPNQRHSPRLARADSGRSRAGGRAACSSCAGRAGTRACAPGCAGGRSSARSLTNRAPLLLRRPMQDSKPPRRLQPRRPPRRLRLRRSPKRPCRRPRQDVRRRKSRASMRPTASRSWSGPGLTPRRIASGYSSGAAAAGPIASRWTSSPRPRLSSRRRRSCCLPPPARSRAHLKRKGRSR